MTTAAICLRRKCGGGSGRIECECDASLSVFRTWRCLPSAASYRISIFLLALDGIQAVILRSANTFETSRQRIPYLRDFGLR